MPREETRVFHDMCRVITATTLLLHSIFGCGFMHACASTPDQLSFPCCHPIDPLAGEKGTCGAEAELRSHERSHEDVHADHGCHTTRDKGRSDTEILIALDHQTDLESTRAFTLESHREPACPNDRDCCTQLECSFISATLSEDLDEPLLSSYLSVDDLRWRTQPTLQISSKTYTQLRSPFGSLSRCALQCSWQI